MGPTHAMALRKVSEPTPEELCASANHTSAYCLCSVRDIKRRAVEAERERLETVVLEWESYALEEALPLGVAVRHLRAAIRRLSSGSGGGSS